MSNGNVVIVGAARTPIGKYTIIKSFKSYQTLVELYVEWFLSVAVYHSLNLSGTLNGSLSSLKAHELGSAAITGALIRSNVRPEEVSDVIMGQVSFLFVNSRDRFIHWFLTYNTWPWLSFKRMIVDDSQVLMAGQGQNPARQAAMNAQIPYDVPASVVSMVCGSGLR